MKKDSYIMFEDCIECNSKYWIFTYKYNALCTLDLENEMVIYTSSIPNEEFCKERLVSKMVAYNNDIILLPMRAKNINIYHIESETWDEVEIPSIEYKDDLNYKFMEAFIYGKYLYAIGCSYPGIIQMDLSEQKIVQTIRCYLDFSKKEDNSIWVRSNYVRKENRLYLASAISNEILILDLNDSNYKVISLGKDNNRYSGIALDNNGTFWLSPLFDTNIVKWDGDKLYNEITINEQDNEGFFLGILVCDEIKILPRALEGDTIIIDKNDNILILKKIFHIYKKIKDNYYLCEDSCGNCYFITNNKVVKKISRLKFDNNLLRIILKDRRVVLNHMVYYEDNLLLKISNYINSIISNFILL